MANGEGGAASGMVIVDADLDNLYYADEPEDPPLPRKRVPTGDVYEAARAGDVDRLKLLLEQGVNVNARDAWDSVALYYTCLAGHLDAALMLLENGAICSEHTFDGDRCHYAALNLRVRKLLKAYEARPPPLDPLPRSLRDLFFGLGTNCKHIDATFVNPSQDFVGDMEEFGVGFAKKNARGDDFVMAGAAAAAGSGVPADIVFHIDGKSVSAHRAILAARSPFFRKKFFKDWKDRREIRFSSKKLKFTALFSLIQFFYTDRLDIAVDDMEDLERVCKVCGCSGLQLSLQKELVHQKFAEYKSLRNVEDSQKRFILQGSSLPEDERLPAAMRRLFHLCLANSGGCIEPKVKFADLCTSDEKNAPSQASNGMAVPFVEIHNKFETRDAITAQAGARMNGFLENSVPNKDIKSNRSSSMLCERLHMGSDLKPSVDNCQWKSEDYADVSFLVEGRAFRSHKAIVAARSDYLKARISRSNGFQEGSWSAHLDDNGMLVLEEHDLSADAFQKLLEFIYTDAVAQIYADQAEEMFDAASRYLLFALKRAVADALLPQLDIATPAELCQWLMIADMYGVAKLREHCLDFMSVNFDIFARTPEFRRLLRVLPPPSGDSAMRTTVPSAPGEEIKSYQNNLLDDLREKWLEAEGAELDKRDESAQQFDKMLEHLVSVSLDELDDRDALCEMQETRL